MLPVHSRHGNGEFFLFLFLRDRSLINIPKASKNPHMYLISEDGDMADLPVSFGELIGKEELMGSDLEERVTWRVKEAIC